MIKRLALALVILALTVGTALAAPITGKIASVDATAKAVVVTLDAEKAPAWVKKGAAIKIKGLGAAKITDVAGKSVTISTSKASEAKSGDSISFDKAGTVGC
jgi:hypothetical protein